MSLPKIKSNLREVTEFIFLCVLAAFFGTIGISATKLGISYMLNPPALSDAIPGAIFGIGVVAFTRYWFRPEQEID